MAIQSKADIIKRLTEAALRVRQVRKAAEAIGETIQLAETEPTLPDTSPLTTGQPFSGENRR